MQGNYATFSFSAVGATEKDCVAILKAVDDRGFRCALGDMFINISGGDGDQMAIRIYKGWTADKTNRVVDKYTLPSTAADWANGTGANQAVGGPVRRPINLDMTPEGFPDGYSAGAARAGLGIYATAERLNGSTNTSGTGEIEFLGYQG